MSKRVGKFETGNIKNVQKSGKFKISFHFKLEKDNLNQFLGKQFFLCCILRNKIFIEGETFKIQIFILNVLK